MDSIGVAASLHGAQALAGAPCAIAGPHWCWGEHPLQGRHPPVPRPQAVEPGWVPGSAGQQDRDRDPGREGTQVVQTAYTGRPGMQPPAAAEGVSPRSSCNWRLVKVITAEL